MLLLLSVAPALAADGGSSAGAPLVGGLVVLVLACAALSAVVRPIGAVVTALAGAGVAAYLARDHLTAKSGADSLCNISDTWNCAVVNTSRWSELLGVPIALYGVGVYAALAWLAWRWHQGKTDAPALLAVGAGVAVLFDAFLGYQMIQLGAGCVLCLTTYALNLVLFVSAALAARRAGFGANLGTALGNHAAAAAIVGLCVYLGGLMVYRSADDAGGAKGSTGDGGGGTATVNLGELYEQAGGTVTYDPSQPVYGDPAARFTLVEWADFQCPHCQWMYGQLKDLLADPANKDVKLIYRNYPISNQCNRFVGHVGHTNACLAAAASECARDQGRFWELAGAMFKNQEYLSKDDIRFMVEQNGLDTAAFETCLARPETGQAVVADVEDGGKAGVQGTPSVYLHGAFGDQWVRVKGDGQELSALLAAARAGTPLPPPGPPEAPPE